MHRKGWGRHLSGSGLVVLSCDSRRGMENGMNERVAIRAVLSALLALYSMRAWAQSEASGNGPEAGIPVTNQLVISKCGTCHAPDEKGNLSRISWERTTPEGWQEAIKRMVRLNGVKLTESDSRAIVKYLATYHGLAPEEAKPVMFLAEHRAVDE